jgi:hypothetical protein
MDRLILYFLVVVLTFSSCNDHLKIEKNNDPQGYADSQFVGSWKIMAASSDVAYDWNNDGSTERDIYNNWSPCEKDHLFTFTGDTASAAYKTGTFKLDCSVTKAGIWQIVEDTSAAIRKFYLVYKPENFLEEAERIISMTSVEFKTAIDLTLPTGQDATITKTWIRQ